MRALQVLERPGTHSVFIVIGDEATAGIVGRLEDLNMAYLPHRRHGPGALGSISDVTTAVRDVVEDPCLFPVAKLVSRLNDLQQPAKPPAPGAPPPPRVKGIGLCSAVRPLKTVTFIAERPWVVPLGITAVFGIVFGLGYLTGREQ